MSYNKGREERRWRIWKEEEERTLRKKGVDEDIIVKLRIYDWEVFNSDRRFYEHIKEAEIFPETIAVEEKETIDTAEKLLDSIVSEEIYQLLITTDRVTLEIVVLRLQGLNYREISRRIGLTEKAVYRRIERLKGKLKATMK